MRRDSENPIVDTMLDELLGGKQPPDLTDQILRRLNDVAEPASSNEATVSVQASRPRRRRSSLVAGLAIAASLLLMVTLLGFIAARLNKQKAGGDHDLADKPAGSSQQQPGAAEDLAPQLPELVEAPTNLEPGAPLRQPDGQPGDDRSDALQLALQSRPTLPMLPNPRVIEEIDRQLATSWVENEIQASPPATDEEWCRRVFLRVIGRIPATGELEQFLDSEHDDRRRQLVDKLLEDEDYVEEYARHWTNIWTNALIGRRGGMVKGDLASREGLQQFLRRSLQQNVPYDQMVYQLVAASGSNTPGSQNYNGAVNFLLASMGKDTSLATSRTTSLFLGLKLQCVQCHDHPFNNVAQERFWQMDAFFAQMKAEPGQSAGLVVLSDTTDPSGSKDARDADVYYERPDGQVKATSASFLGQSASAGSQLNEISLREELALRIRYSDELPRALVNRIWSHFFGHGFTVAIDEMGAHNPASHPELLAALSDQFEAHDYNLKSLIRWIALSEPFGLSSQATEGNLADLPDGGGVPMFSRYYTRSMQPEEVYQSLLMVAGVRRPETGFVEQQLAQRSWLGQFAQRMGNDEAEEASSFEGDVHQSLVMMNGPLMQRVTSPMEEGVLAEVLGSQMSSEGKVEHMFLAAISRRPTAREQKMIGEMLGNSNNPAATLQDIWWALLNSNEFILDH